MKLRFIWVGRTKKAPVKELVEEYLGRIKKYARVEVHELRDQMGQDAGRIIEKEGEDILAHAGPDPFVVALDERGRQLSSTELAEFMGRHRLEATRQMTFILGGHQGLADAVRGRADLVLSLSPMTMPHELARVVLLEQVYRAFTILHGLPYQK